MSLPARIWTAPLPDAPAAQHIDCTAAEMLSVRDYIRTIRNSMTGNIAVHISDGDVSTFAFTDGDSGLAETKRVVWSANNLGGVRILGGYVVDPSDWELYSGSIYRTQLAARCDTIYENGIRAIKCRTPSYSADPLYPMARNTYRITEGLDGSRLILQYIAGQLSPGGWDLTDAQAVIWSGGSNGGGTATINWFMDIDPIVSLNLGARQFTLERETRYEIYGGDPTKRGARYFIQGVLSFLNGPGQFHFDSNTGFLYYWPRDGAIEDQEIIVPTALDAVTNIGASTNARVSYITVDGFELCCTNIGPRYRHADPFDNMRGGGAYDRQYSLPEAQHGAVYCENTDHLRYTRCKFANTGLHGVYKKGYNQSHIYDRCWFTRMGHSGSYVEGNYPGTTDVNKLHQYYNCRFNKIGELCGSGISVALVQSGYNNIRGCLFEDGTRGHVFIGAYPSYTAPEIYAAANIVEYDRMLRGGQDSGDFAAIDMFGTCGAAGSICRNIVIDTMTSTASMGDFPNYGVFLDNNSPNQTLINVLNLNTALGGDGDGVAAAVDSLPGLTRTNVGINVTFDMSQVGLQPGYPWPLT